MRPLTAEQFEERRAELRRQHVRAISNLSAIEGAMQELELWAREAGVDEATVEAETPQPGYPAGQPEVALNGSR